MLNLLLFAPSEGGFSPLDLSHGGGALWTWVIFLAALPFIWKVVLGPVSKALFEREARVAESLGAALRASQEAQDARAQVEKQLLLAREEAAKLINEARVRGEERAAEIVSAAQAEALKAGEVARASIRAEQGRALAAIRAEVVELSLSAATQVLKRKVDSADDRRLAGELVGAAKGKQA